LFQKTKQKLNHEKKIHLIYMAQDLTIILCVLRYRFAPFKHSDTFIRRATLEYLQSIYDMFDLIMDDPNITTFIFEFLNISTILPMLKPRGKKKKRRRKKRKQSVLVEIKNEKNLPKPQVKKKKKRRRRN
jgi:hypothetical protein